jgi:uncharacterized protein YhaN
MKQDSSIIAFTATQIAHVCMAIEYIKRGQLETSIERLERSIDACVLRLNRDQDKADPLIPAQKNNILDALKIVKNHRRRHARQTKKDNSETPLTDIENQVKKILEELGG